jgi:hypothetical protein
MMHMEAVKIEIPNENNKLHCNAFVQIGPEPGVWKESSFDRLYSIRVGDEDRFYKLVDFIRIRFIDVGSAFTIPACGLESQAWRHQYNRDHPDTTNETKMAIYFFKRHE